MGTSLVNGLKRLHQLPEIGAPASCAGVPTSRRASATVMEKGILVPADNAQSLLAERFDSAKGPSSTRLSTPICTYLPGDLLVKSDRMAMAASIEPRSPFLDHKMIEWSRGCRISIKIRGRSGKYLLKKAFAIISRERPQAPQAGIRDPRQRLVPRSVTGLVEGITDIEGQSPGSLV